ncbi:MFS transporter [Mesorhizobium sp. BAC0120]|uniref:MFS transporter n=1 Tax=Mesorhizobium sp. BAC0120 TaxID=3090670 RepID=UPI00298CCFA1|nr:MFS transporter [Mesorhizobium sp. BAC0120]MDW6024879.1 MFS transporter [Mesorhizobium sp. BAC0120]
MPAGERRRPGGRAATQSLSFWAPFRHKPFTVIWLATLVANIGSWMYSAACGWLMTSLTTAPLMVSLVQVAATLPVFLLAIAGGALVDIVDKRKFLIAGEMLITLAASVFAVVIWFHLVTSWNLLVFAFLVAAGEAVTAPAWEAVVSLLVPKPDLPMAVAANSVSVNVSRAVGPALGGALLGTLGVPAPFLLNAVSNLGVIGALAWWPEPARASSRLPPEHFASAMITGLRHARYNPHLMATLIRAAGFFVFASAYWALLPLVARQQVGGGPSLYGSLLGVIGISAVATAALLPRLKEWLGADGLGNAGALGSAVATALFGVAHEPVLAIAASVVAGSTWITTVSSLNVSAQTALPEWVRGRGLAVYITVMAGALSLGSAIWGEGASRIGIAPALLVAAVGGGLSVPLLRRWRLQTARGIDLTPAMSWPSPAMASDINPARGPVLVTIAYRIDPRNREAFLEAIELAGRERYRDGAYGWQVFEDPGDNSRFIETFLSDSWADHLRLHERVTKADQAQEAAVRRFQKGDGPQITHFIAARSHVRRSRGQKNASSKSITRKPKSHAGARPKPDIGRTVSGTDLDPDEDPTSD